MRMLTYRKKSEMKYVMRSLLMMGLIVTSACAAYSEAYVYCTHGLRKFDDGPFSAYTQTALFRLSDLTLKTEKGWQYEIPCSSATCDITTSENSVLIHKKIAQGHELYLTLFDKPNMEIIIDRTRVINSGKRTVYIEFQCDWYEMPK